MSGQTKEQNKEIWGQDEGRRGENKGSTEHKEKQRETKTEELLQKNKEMTELDVGNKHSFELFWLQEFVRDMTLDFLLPHLLMNCLLYQMSKLILF